MYPQRKIATVVTRHSCESRVFLSHKSPSPSQFYKTLQPIGTPPSDVGYLLHLLTYVGDKNDEVVLVAPSQLGWLSMSLVPSPLVRPVFYTTLQSIGALPSKVRYSLHLLKHFDDKNGELVLVAPSGLGWLVLMT